MPDCIYCEKPIEPRSGIWWRLPNGVSKDIHLECWDKLDDFEWRALYIQARNEVYYKDIDRPIITPEEIDKSREWYENRAKIT